MVPDFFAKMTYISDCQEHASISAFQKLVKIHRDRQTPLVPLFHGDYFWSDAEQLTAPFYVTIHWGVERFWAVVGNDTFISSSVCHPCFSPSHYLLLCSFSAANQKITNPKQLCIQIVKLISRLFRLCRRTFAREVSPSTLPSLGLYLKFQFSK